MGLRLAYEPTLVRLPQDKKIKRVAATSKSVCAITSKDFLLKRQDFNII